jgi:hypothetical protein
VKSNLFDYAPVEPEYDPAAHCEHSEAPAFSGAAGGAVRSCRMTCQWTALALLRVADTAKNTSLSIEIDDD